jgi:uncharacterized protein (DUF58 family)
VSPAVDLAPARTPARPGPGPVPEAALRALDVAVRRRVDSLLGGEYRSTHLGEATELAQLRLYEPGDDTRQIDWNATARTGEAHVRVHVAERALTTWLLLDSSASMQFGTADRRKADVAEGVMLALGHVATRRSNRLGLLTFGGSEPTTARPRQGRNGLLAALLALRLERDAGQDGATSLAAGLDRAGRLARQRAHVVVVSDLRGTLDWPAPLTRLTHRHQVTVVEIRDEREDALTDVGEIVLADRETGRQLRVDTSDARLRDRFADAARTERARVAQAVRHAGAHHIVLDTRGDWLRPLLAAVAPRRRAR